jgi:mannitol-1-/sugar-/sorbitol-6-phosphatase
VEPFAVTTTHTADQVASADVIVADLSCLDVESTDDGVVLNAREAQ